MPLINVKLIEDGFTAEQKGQIVERLAAGKHTPMALPRY